MRTRIHRLLIPAAALLVAACSGSADPQAATAQDAGAIVAPHAAQDARTACPAEGRDMLLELAFEAASGFPTVPHLKNRARAKEAVVLAALAVARPERAVAVADSIENWRRGLCHAEIAFWAAREGDALLQDASLAAARGVAAWPEERFEQEWRRNEVLARITAVEQWDAHPAEAAAARAAGSAPRTADLDAVYALLATRAEAEALVGGVGEAVLAGSLDQVMAAVQRSLRIYERFGDDPALRAQVAAELDATEGKVPLAFFLDAQLALGEADARRGESAAAAARADRAAALVAERTWLPRDLIPLRARIATLRARAGQPERARAELEAALDLFELEREAIVDIRRASALLPVAAAYASLGDRDAALAVVARATAEAQVNPNARPRAVDLVAICCLLAVEGLEPDAALAAELRRAVGGLGDPW